MTFPTVEKKKEMSNAAKLNILNEFHFKWLNHKAQEVWVECLTIMLPPPEYFPVSVCVAYVSLALS